MNEIWDRRRQKLEAELLAAAEALMAHMNDAESLCIPYDDKRYIALGTPEGIRGLLPNEARHPETPST